MNTEEHDDLWRLLGKVRTPSASPFFSRNVQRAIREERQETTGVFAWLRRHWQLGALGTCAVAVAVAALALAPGPQRTEVPDPTALLAEQLSQSIDYQVISNLDELIASEESLAWLEN